MPIYGICNSATCPIGVRVDDGKRPVRAGELGRRCDGRSASRGCGELPVKSIFGVFKATTDENIEFTC